jgi:hypothetical protein
MNAKLNVVLTPAIPSVGLIDAQPGMPLIEGTLTAVSGNLVTVTRPDGTVFRDYAHNLRILAAEAAGYGWPRLRAASGSSTAGRCRASPAAPAANGGHSRPAGHAHGPAANLHGR